MNTETVSVASLKPYPGNPRRHSSLQISEMARSIEKYGQIRPIVCDENGTILVGHCIHLALQQMKREEAIVLRKVDLDENEKKRLILADNKISDLGTDDFDQLWALIESMEGNYDIPGYDDNVLTELLHNVDETAMNLGADLEKKEGSEFRSQFSSDPVSQEVMASVHPVVASEPNAKGERMLQCPYCKKMIKI
jgi:hypothetical protein